MKRIFLLVFIFSAFPVLVSSKEEPEMEVPSEGQSPQQQGEGPSVRYKLSVSRFGKDIVSSLVSYEFDFQTDSQETKSRFYKIFPLIKSEVTIKLTEYLSNPAHNPKNLPQIKRFMVRLMNRIYNKRFPEKKEGKIIYRNFITGVFIKKIFERKL